MTPMPPPITVADLMACSGVGFGTSGARGRVADLTDRVCYAYTAAFLQHLRARGELPAAGAVALGGDLRPSTGRLLRAAARAVADQGHAVVHCGRLPSPALALYGLAQGVPAIMVTGSHIPADRNGIKYNKPSGEILKDDEAGICGQAVAVPPGLFDDQGRFVPGAAPDLPPVDPQAAEGYVRRYLEAFPPGCLGGLRVGLYEHSAVGRDLLFEILAGLGAEVTRLGRSDEFVPVDTEAIRPEDAELARQWAAPGRFDALASADGDSDRPLVGDEAGQWLRGDVAGLVTARFLGADCVVVPVSCNTAVEACGAFRQVRRTRIGSPYVIAEMDRALAEGGGAVVGYEANGGFLTASPLHPGPGVLRPLPTRDAALVIVAVLLAARAAGTTVSGLRAGLPQRFTASDRLGEFPTDQSRRALAALASPDPAEARARFAAAFGGHLGAVEALDATDGLRATFTGGRVVHLRPSGNAPEFRCYTEARSPTEAEELLSFCLATMETWRRAP